MKYRFILLTACLFCLVSTARPTFAENRKPNVVLIIADDLGYRELGCFGQERIRTPNLDQLAAQGMRLTQHYSGNAVCAPSRCVLMTGKHPGHAWVRNNRKMQPEGQEPIPDREITLAELFRKQGYTTGAFGKWGLGGPGSSGEPLRQGFDRFFGYNCQSHAHSYYPSYLWSNSQRITLANNPPVPGHASLPVGADPADPRSYDVFKGQEYAPDLINRRVLEFIRGNQSNPFFLYYPTIIPHVALHVPDDALKPYLALGWNDPPFTREKDFGYTPHFTPRAAYAAMITRMDGYVGNILKLLEELKLADNTIVVFSSDNGTTHLDQEVDYEFFESVGELRGLKGSLYEGGVRVPTIVRWPGHVPAGSDSEFLSGFEDWMPTLMDLTGNLRSAWKDVDGISLAPTLLGQDQAPRSFLYREFSGYGGQQSIRVGKWKAIRQNMVRGSLGVELYDLSDDIAEQNDISSQHIEIVSRLVKLMEQEHTRSAIFPLKPVDSSIRNSKTEQN